MIHSLHRRRPIGRGRWKIVLMYSLDERQCGKKMFTEIDFEVPGTMARSFYGWRGGQKYILKLLPARRYIAALNGEILKEGQY